MHLDATHGPARWPAWIDEATRLLTGYSLVSGSFAGGDVVVDDINQTVEVPYTSNTEQLLGAVLIAAVFAITGVSLDTDSQSLAEIFYFPGQKHAG